MCVTIASVLSHLVVRLRLFYKINKSKRKINIDLAVVASQIPGGAVHDKLPIAYHKYICSSTKSRYHLWEVY